MTARTGRALLAGVIGHPVAHSLSPALHEYWLAEHGIDGAYIPLNLGEEHFSSALDTLYNAGFQGANVTLPHKARAFAVAREHDESARLTGAVNTLIRREDGGFLGKNTDVQGFIENLRTGGIDPTTLNHALILGAGGAGRGVAAGLALHGCRMITFANRTLSSAERLAQELSASLGTARFQAVSWHERNSAAESADLLVNTTQLGMHGQQPLDFDVHCLPASASVCDIVYNPLETQLLSAARGRGLHVVGGLGMLLHQAAPGFEAWFGVRPRVTSELYAHIARMIGT